MKLAEVLQEHGWRVIVEGKRCSAEPPKGGPSVPGAEALERIYESMRKGKQDVSTSSDNSSDANAK